MARTKAISDSTEPDPPTTAASGGFGSSGSSQTYTVVARRYRPQTFEDVVGQDHVVHALRNAIRMDRVAQAYLFSGTRGVGKTSMARIFAKCLNCKHGPTETPCNQCEICRDISSGDDIDVIEIDGASNNGVDAVRELRQNASLRPSRGRFKIYYIDEVHMLSTGAFNALLKTLEEPPSHVKFLFATTEPNRIPITVLSRCQRFDFAGIGPEQIADTLSEICTREGVETEPGALQIVARRALGSMRDAQSLLERLLASGQRPLTVDAVQQVLGIAGDDRVLDLLDSLADRDGGRVLLLIDQAVQSGIQPVDVIGAVIEFLRDAMVVATGATNVPLLAVSPAQRPRLESVVARWTLDTILAAQQIVSEARGRMRGSPYSRLLVELALCRIARLENLVDLGQLIATFREADGKSTSTPAVKKKLTPHELAPRATPGAVSIAEAPATPRNAEPEQSPLRDQTSSEDAASSDSVPRSDGQPRTLEEAWATLLEQEQELATRLGGMVPRPPTEDGVLVVSHSRSYNWALNVLRVPEVQNRINAQLGQLLQCPVQITFELDDSLEPPPTQRSTALNPHSMSDDVLVKQLIEMFEARPLRVEVDPEASTHSEEGGA